MTIFQSLHTFDNVTKMEGVCLSFIFSTTIHLIEFTLGRRIAEDARRYNIECKLMKSTVHIY